MRASEEGTRSKGLGGSAGAEQVPVILWGGQHAAVSRRAAGSRNETVLLYTGEGWLKRLC